MNQSVISDNWSLQNIAELFRNGLEDESTHLVNVDLSANKYEYNEISNAVISIEALFDFITDIILRDQILVEKNYINTWKQFDSPLNKVEEASVVRAFPFAIDYKKLEEPTEEFINRLCVTDDLKKDHEENRSGWNENSYTPHEYLSQTLWGGAGMLARSFVYERSYTPHPVRKRFFVSTGLTLPNNSVNSVNNIITEKRASMVSIQKGNDELHSMAINMPPLPIRVIQESNSVSDLIPVALQLRDDYQELREWLGRFQQAMSDGEYKEIAKFQKIIKSISLYVDSLMGASDSNSPAFSMGIGVLKIPVKGQPINALKNQFGVRSMINKLIVSRSGSDELNKFLGFWGHKKTNIGLQVLKHFSNT